MLLVTIYNKREQRRKYTLFKTSTEVNNVLIKIARADNVELVGIKKHR